MDTKFIRHPVRSFLIGVLYCCLAVISIWPAQATDQKSNLVFILDGSGSMWGRVNGEMKIVIAKRVMSSLLEQMPPDVDVGLVVYGHRRKGDCQDIESVAALGTVPGSISASINSVMPRGKTPLAAAIQQGADLLSGQDKLSTLVLVSDGIETCDGDPCALARDLTAQGVELVIHTIGFGVNDEAAIQLECIAGAANGRYFPADSGEALAEALVDVQQAVVEREPLVLPPKPPAQETVQSHKIVVAGPGTIVLELAPWAKLPNKWAVLNAETGDEIGRIKGKDRLRIKPGEYQLSWRQNQHGNPWVPLSEVVSVAARETVTVPIETGLRLVPPQGTRVPYRWTLRRSDESEAMGWFKGTLEPQVVPAGQYELSWHQKEHGSRPVSLGEVKIIEGQLNEHRLEAGMVLQQADWVPGNPYRYELQNDQGEVKARFNEIGPQLVAPGEYKIIYRQTEHAHSKVLWQELTVPPRGFATVAIDSGVNFIPQEGFAPPYQAIFVNLDSGLEIVWRGNWSKKWEPIPIPPGRYKLDWRETEHNDPRMTFLEEFIIPPATLVEVQL